MKKPSCHDELTIRHRFDRLCQMSLKGEAINYYRHMDYRREHEAMFSELSEKELNQLSVMDEYGVENSHFTVHGYDIEVKDTLIAEALQALSERKRNVILLSYFLEMSDADIAQFGADMAEQAMLLDNDEVNAQAAQADPRAMALLQQMLG